MLRYLRIRIDYGSHPCWWQLGGVRGGEIRRLIVNGGDEDEGPELNKEKRRDCLLGWYFIGENDGQQEDRGWIKDGHWSEERESWFLLCLCSKTSIIHSRARFLVIVTHNTGGSAPLGISTIPTVRMLGSVPLGISTVPDDQREHCEDGNFRYTWLRLLRTNQTWEYISQSRDLRVTKNC
ncbi:uncharacterized protein LOC115998966 [Ipomoea triloba]|uniref:uncharacterized protein LOC115998966 n=1 Tax=Ipomoea triloba TaxID=35885 RepID=UPI00125D0160|nr:uncharacterized protein LOC115998966 [Ipomoea triloba]